MFLWRRQYITQCRINEPNMDIPFRYLPDETFTECARLLNPTTTKYSWKILAQKLGVPVEDIRYIESPCVANADLPPAALTLQWFQYGGLIKNGKLPNHYREKGGTLATIIKKLGEFPRPDVIELLEDETIHKVMQDRFNQDKDSNNNERKSPVEDADSVGGFLRDGNPESKASKDDQGDIDNVNIKLDSGNINIIGTAQVIIHVRNGHEGGRATGNDSGDMCEKCVCRTHEQNSVASGFCGSDTSGSGTPSPGDSPPWNGARPKERTEGNFRRPSGGSPGKSGFINGYHNGTGPRQHGSDVPSTETCPPWDGTSRERRGCNFRKKPFCQHAQRRPSGSSSTFKRQDSNTSVSSCEMLLPGSLSQKGLLTDTDSEASSLDSGELEVLMEQLQPRVVADPPCKRCGKRCSNKQGQCKRTSDPLVGSKLPAPFKTQLSEIGTSGTRRRNNSEPNVLQIISGPVLLLCDKNLMKNENSRKILTTIGGAIRKCFKLTDNSDTVQFSLWSPERCRYTRKRNIPEEITQSLEKSALIVIFANRRYLKVIAEVEQALHENDNFIPEVKPGKCNVHYVYHQIRANHHKLLGKIIIFCREDDKDRLPIWLRNLGIVAPWPERIDDVMDILWSLLAKQAKLILRGLSDSS